jgi:hypothetical protein
MSTIRPTITLSVLLIFLATNTQGAHHRSLVFQDNFEGRSEIGDAYFTALAGDDAWVIQDGILIGKQTNPAHGAVIRTELPFADIDIVIDFRFSGGSRFNFVIDDNNEKSVHAGHICRVSISPNNLKISDDKTGNMNLSVRAKRQSETLSEGEKKSLQDLLDRSAASAELSLTEGRWYQLRVRIQNDLMEAYIDSKLVASLRSPGIAHPTKTKFGMTVNGATIDFDNLLVYQASSS